MISNTKFHNNYSITKFQKKHILQFGVYGFKVLHTVRLTDTQLKNIIWLIKKKLQEISKKNYVKFWSLISLNLVLTTLGLESRMGKGKGIVSSKAVFLKPGTILFEFDNLSKYQVTDLLQFINKKFPGKIKLINRFH